MLDPDNERSWLNDISSSESRRVQPRCHRHLPLVSIEREEIQLAQRVAQVQRTGHVPEIGATLKQ